MNWKEEAIQRLADYETMCTSVTGMRKEIKRLELEAQSLSSSGLVRIGSGIDNREDRKINNLVRRGELSEALQQAALWVDVTDHALGCLNSQERQLLSSMYIRGDWGNASQLAQQLGIERSTVYRKRDDALRKFTLAMYGRC